MCRAVTCSSCGKPTYAGCGMHVDQVLADVPREARCRCREQAKSTSNPESTTPKGSLLDRLFGR